jgi:hypothetical protein
MAENLQAADANRRIAIEAFPAKDTFGSGGQI